VFFNVHKPEPGRKFLAPLCRKTIFILHSFVSPDKMLAIYFSFFVQFYFSLHLVYNNFNKKQKGIYMKTAAIICEYNPFHNGHAYHIRRTREETGARCVIALMSGNYVQRGTPAIM